MESKERKKLIKQGRLDVPNTLEEEWLLLTLDMLWKHTVEEVRQRLEKVIEIKAGKQDNEKEFVDAQKWEQKYYLKELDKFQGNIKKAIDEKLKIIDIAKQYGLKIKGSKANCPFHAEKQPSLVFYPETNSFYCFGCTVGGDIFMFIKKMEELNAKKGSS